jgi:hypothetical protein
VARLLDLLDEGPALDVEGPGVHPGETWKRLDVREGLPTALEHREHGVLVLHDELQVQHGRAG